MATAAAIRDAIAQVIQNWADNNLPRSVAVGTQNFSFQSLAEANDAYRFWCGQAAAETAAAGTTSPLRQFGVRFRGPQ